MHVYPIPLLLFIYLNVDTILSYVYLFNKIAVNILIICYHIYNLCQCSHHHHRYLYSPPHLANSTSIFFNILQEIIYKKPKGIIWDIDDIIKNKSKFSLGLFVVTWCYRSKHGCPWHGIVILRPILSHPQLKSPWVKSGNT